MLLFPLTIWYFSPAIIMMALAKHILNGSFFVFLGMFVFSMFGGRLICGFLCPVGGMQECVAEVNNKTIKAGKKDYIKFGIWTIWLCALGYFFFSGTGDIIIEFTYLTTYGISVAEITDYITYYMVITLVLLPALIHGKRATCHYICWMSPFMIIGSKLGQKLHFPQLHVKADVSRCTSCKACTKACSMGIDVEQLVKKNSNICHRECINCGKCVDACPNKTLSYSFKWK